MPGKRRGFPYCAEEFSYWTLVAQSEVQHAARVRIRLVLGELTHPSDLLVNRNSADLQEPAGVVRAKCLTNLGKYRRLQGGGLLREDDRDIVVRVVRTNE